MGDPTYNIDEIKANPIWYSAWIMSEWFNTNAPIGWSAYISCAESIRKKVYNMED